MSLFILSDYLVNYSGKAAVFFDFVIIFAAA